MSAPSAEVQPVGPFLRVLSGFPFPSAGFRDDGSGTPLIRIRDLLPGKTETSFVGSFDPTYVVITGDTLVGMDGDFNCVDWAGAPALLNQRVCKITANGHELDHRYFRHWLPTKLAEIHRKTPQTTVRHLSTYDLEAISVPFFPRPEQARIAEVLDTLDEAIRRTEQVIEKCMSVRQGLLHDLLTLGINENGELRNSHRESFLPSPIGSLPSTWRARQVGSLLQGIEQGWSPDCAAEPAESGAWGVLKTTAVVWDGYQDHENKALPSHLRPRPELEVRCGDVLMTRGGPNSRVGVVARVESTQGRLMLSDKLYRLVPKAEIGNAFLALALSGSRTQIHLSRLKTGLAESQTNISQAIVRALLIPLPPAEEQERIVTCYSATVKRITEDQELLHRLRALKAGLASDLLTGRVRVAPGVSA